MDPNNNQPQGDDNALKKIEEDLQKLSSEAAVKAPINDLPPVPPAPETPMSSVGMDTKIETPSFPAQHNMPTPPVMSTDKPADVSTPASPVPVSNPPSGNEKKGSPLLLVSIILVVIALLAAVAYVIGASYIKNKSGSPVACTADAKLCPDGSSVGRSGPNCEFDACPAAPVATPILTPVNQGTPSATPNATTSGNLNVRTGLSPASSPAASPSSSPITY